MATKSKAKQKKKKAQQNKDDYMIAEQAFFIGETRDLLEKIMDLMPRANRNLAIYYLAQICGCVDYEFRFKQTENPYVNFDKLTKHCGVPRDFFTNRYFF